MKVYKAKAHGQWHKSNYNDPEIPFNQIYTRDVLVTAHNFEEAVSEVNELCDCCRILSIVTLGELEN